MEFGTSVDGSEIGAAIVHRLAHENRVEIYGAAKAGLDALAQGLADAVDWLSARVLVIRPGFVSTRLTAGFKPAPLSTSPQVVADATVAALGGRTRTVWVPGALRYVFAVLRHLPRPEYRRLPL